MFLAEILGEGPRSHAGCQWSMLKGGRFGSCLARTKQVFHRDTVPQITALSSFEPQRGGEERDNGQGMAAKERKERKKKITKVSATESSENRALDELHSQV